MVRGRAGVQPLVGRRRVAGGQIGHGVRADAIGPRAVEPQRADAGRAAVRPAGRVQAAVDAGAGVAAAAARVDVLVVLVLGVQRELAQVPRPAAELAEVVDLERVGGQ